MSNQIDILAARNTAMHYAIETHPARFDVSNKPELDDLIERARKIEAFLTAEGIRD